MSYSSWILAIILLTVLVLYQQHLCFAGENEWTSIGPEGEEIIALAIDPVTPSTIYAGTWGSGFYKTTDGGNNWFAVNLGLEPISLAIDPVTPSTVYVGTEQGVYKTTDGGGNWVAVNTGLPLDIAFGQAWGQVETLAIDPLTSGTVYALLPMEGVYKTTDGGSNWFEVNSGLKMTTFATAGFSFYSVTSLAIDPVTPSTVYAGATEGVYKTTDGGGNWVAVNKGLPNTDYSGVSVLAIDPVTPSTVYAGTGEGVYKTTDGGGNWVAVNSGLLNTTYGMAIPTLAIDPVTPTTLYVAAGGKVGGNFISRVFKTTNGGVKWTEVNTGFPPAPFWDDQFVRAIVVDPVSPTRVYAGTWGYGVFSIDFVESEPPDDGGGSGSSSSGGGGGGCSIASDASPSHLVFFLIPLLLLLGRKAMRKFMFF